MSEILVGILGFLCIIAIVVTLFRSITLPSIAFILFPSILGLILVIGGYYTFDNLAALIKAGGPMMGLPQTTLYTPIMKGSNGIIAIDTDEPETQECIKCGRCVDVCPMELQPLYFAKLVGDPAALKAKNIMDCMECRCCEYICSSKIPLVNLIKIGKNAVRGMK